MGRIIKNCFTKNGKKPIDIVSLSNNGRSRRHINYYDVTTQYIKWYNREVCDFLDVTPYVYPKLHSSYVHVNSKYEFHKHAGEEEKEEEEEEEEEENEYESDDEENEVEYGSYWTSIEKRMFFQCLSRYSIHRIDDWYPLFNGTKSKIEVLTYYHVLKRNLKLVKEKLPNLLNTYEDYPISYEMDDNFIEFDEHMSRRLIDRDRLEYYYDNKPVNIDNTGGGGGGGNLIVNFDKWNQVWTQFYYKRNKILKEKDVDTRYPEFIEDEMEYKNGYEIERDIIELRGKEYRILQYRPILEDHEPNSSQNIKDSKKCIPFNKESMEYFERCIRGYIRDVLYYTVLSGINRRSIHGDHVNKLLQYSSKRKDFNKKILNKKYKKGIKMSVKSSKKDFVVKDEDRLKGKILYPHVITKRDIETGLMIMRQEYGKYNNSGSGSSVNKSIELINAINKFEMKLDNKDYIFKERWFLRSLMNEMVYDKWNHPIPIVMDSKYNDIDKCNVDLLDEYNRLIKNPVDQELKTIIGLMRKKSIHLKPRGTSPSKMDDDKENNRFKFEIINDEEKYIGWGSIINTILNKRLDNELELELIDKETNDLERKDQIESRRYMDTLYHYFGSILSMTPPGANADNRHFSDSNNITTNRLYVMVDEDEDEKEENTTTNTGIEEEQEQDYIWPSSVKVFERTNF